MSRRYYRKISITERLVSLAIGIMLLLTMPTWASALGRALETAFAAHQEALR